MYIAAEQLNENFTCKTRTRWMWGLPDSNEALTLNETTLEKLYLRKNVSFIDKKDTHYFTCQLEVYSKLF